MLYFAINYSKSKNALLSPTWAQAKKVFKEIVNAIESSNIIKSSNASDLIIKLTNCSEIQFFSAAQKENLRGYTVSGILCIDEAAFIDDDVYFLTLPWVDYHKAPTLICSTPFIKSGFFYNNYNYGYERTNYVTVDWTDEKYAHELEKILSNETLNEYKKILPSNQFKSEYLGQFLDNDGMVFQMFKENVSQATEIAKNDKLFVGIDWASGTDNDDTVISVINDKGEQVILDYFNNVSPLSQIDRIENILRPYTQQIRSIQSEINSIGNPMTEMLRKRFPNTNFVEFTTTNKSKNELVTQLQVAFEQNNIKIIDDDKQLRELRNI